MRNKIIILHFFYFFQTFVFGQTFLNSNDGLYYVDTSYQTLANGVIGYVPIRYMEDSSGYEILDSVNFEFDNGNLIWKTVFDNQDSYQLYKLKFENNRIFDSVYDFTSRIYFNDEYTEIIERVNFFNGKRSGSYFKYYLNDPSFEFEIGSYKDGLLHGLITEFNKNGFPLNETVYKDGKISGFERTYFFNSNQIQYEAQYKNGLANGKLITWWENGNVRAVTDYINNKPMGKSVVYLENGDTAIVQIVENGIALRTEQYVRDVENLKNLRLLFPSKDNTQKFIRK